jgi:hypothetical protein
MAVTDARTQSCAVAGWLPEVPMTEEATEKGEGAVEATEAALAWQVEDSVPEPVLPEEPQEETRSWSETFKAIAKYGGMAALVALVGLMFLDDHLPRHLHQAIAVHQTPVANVPPAAASVPPPAVAPPAASFIPTVVFPPPVTVTETEPAPRPAGPANVNPETTARFHALLRQDGLYSTDSGPELAQVAQQVCEDGANHNVGPDIAATQQKDNIPFSAAARIVYDVLDAFCPQYGDNPNPPTQHDVRTE